MTEKDIFKKNGDLKKIYTDRILKGIYGTIIKVIESLVKEEIKGELDDGKELFPMLLEETRRLQSLCLSGSIANDKTHDSIMKEFIKLSSRVSVLEKK